MVISSDQSQYYITLTHLGEYELLSACIWDEYGGYEPVAARITEGLGHPWFGSTFKGLISNSMSTWLWLKPTVKKIKILTLKRKQ